MAGDKGLRTAHRILDTAEELFARVGYREANLRDIAAGVGIQQPGLYKHFKNKDELYRKVYERALQPLADLMDRLLETGSDDPHFTGLPELLTDLLAEHPNIPRLLIRATLADPQPDDVAMHWLRSLAEYGRRLTASVEANPSEETLALQIVAIFNMMFGYFWASPLIEMLTGRPSTDAGLRTVQKRLLRSFIAGMVEGEERPSPPEQKSDQ